MTTDEKWLPIAGYEGFYDVSDLGRVRSVDRTVMCRNRWGQICERRFRGRILKPGRDHTGHLIVILSVNGKLTNRQVHRLVAEAFIGPLPPGLETRHLDGDPGNNAAANLAYGTHAENMQDMVGHGRCPNKLLTHCPQGHEYTPENTKRIPSRPTARYCRECHRIDNRERMRRKRAA